MSEELTDQQWALIQPLLPPRKRRGRPRADDRRVLNGIFWVLRTGARWKDLPPQYGNDSPCHRRLQQWQAQGVWERTWKVFLGVLDAQGRLNWSQAFLDGSFAQAKKGGRASAMAAKGREAPSTS